MIVAVSSSVKEKLVEIFHLNPESIQVVSTGVKHVVEKPNLPKDPLKIFKAKVTEAGLLEKSQLEEIDKESKKKIKQAIIESKEAAFPKEADLLTDVYINY